MSHTPKLGPLALLLTVISICLTILSILSFTTAGADMRLAEKYGETVSERYALEAKGQALIRDLDEGLEDGIVAKDFEKADAEGVYESTIKEGDLSLHIGVSIQDGTYEIISWKYEHDWVQNTDLGNLWPGNN